MSFRKPDRSSRKRTRQSFIGQMNFYCYCFLYLQSYLVVKSFLLRHNPIFLLRRNAHRIQAVSAETFQPGQVLYLQDLQSNGILKERTQDGSWLIELYEAGLDSPQKLRLIERNEQALLSCIDVQSSPTIKLTNAASENSKEKTNSDECVNVYDVSSSEVEIIDRNENGAESSTTNNNSSTDGLITSHLPLQNQCRETLQLLESRMRGCANQQGSLIVKIVRAQREKLSLYLQRMKNATSALPKHSDKNLADTDITEMRNQIIAIRHVDLAISKHIIAEANALYEDALCELDSIQANCKQLQQLYMQSGAEDNQQEDSNDVNHDKNAKDADKLITELLNLMEAEIKKGYSVMNNTNDLIEGMKSALVVNEARQSELVKRFPDSTVAVAASVAADPYSQCSPVMLQPYDSSVPCTENDINTEYDEMGRAVDGLR